MPLPDIIQCTLGKKGLTTVMEVRQYFQDAGKEEQTVSKQDYLQQRRKLNPQVFKLENRKAYGESENRYGKGVARANISGAYDVYNGFLPDIGIHPYTSNEIKEAKEHIPEIKGIVGERPVIRIFDRNYASLESIDYVEGEGTQYVIRLRQGEYKGEVGVPGGGESGEAAIKHTEKRLRGVKEEEPERAEELKRKGATRARVIKMAFKEGEGALITNIKGYTEEQIRGLYRERREIEQR